MALMAVNNIVNGIFETHIRKYKYRKLFTATEEEPLRKLSQYVNPVSG